MASGVTSFTGSAPTSSPFTGLIAPRNPNNPAYTTTKAGTLVNVGTPYTPYFGLTPTTSELQAKQSYQANVRNADAFSIAARQSLSPFGMTPLSSQQAGFFSSQNILVGSTPTTTSVGQVGGAAYTFKSIPLPSQAPTISTPTGSAGIQPPIPNPIPQGGEFMGKPSELGYAYTSGLFNLLPTGYSSFQQGIPQSRAITLAKTFISGGPFAAEQAIFEEGIVPSSLLLGKQLIGAIKGNQADIGGLAAMVTTGKLGETAVKIPEYVNLGETYKGLVVNIPSKENPTFIAGIAQGKFTLGLPTDLKVPEVARIQPETPAETAIVMKAMSADIAAKFGNRFLALVKQTSASGENTFSYVAVKAGEAAPKGTIAIGTLEQLAGQKAILTFSKGVEGVESAFKSKEFTTPIKALSETGREAMANVIKNLVGTGQIEEIKGSVSQYLQQEAGTFRPNEGGLIGDIDVYLSKYAKLSDASEAIVKQLTAVGEKVRVSAKNPKVIETILGEKIVEFKQGIEDEESDSLSLQRGEYFGFGFKTASPTVIDNVPIVKLFEQAQRKGVSAAGFNPLEERIGAKGSRFKEYADFFSAGQNLIRSLELTGGSASRISLLKESIADYQKAFPLAKGIGGGKQEVLIYSSKLGRSLSVSGSSLFGYSVGASSSSLSSGLSGYSRYLYSSPSSYGKASKYGSPSKGISKYGSPYAKPSFYGSIYGSPSKYSSPASPSPSRPSPSASSLLGSPSSFSSPSPSVSPSSPSQQPYSPPSPPYSYPSLPPSISTSYPSSYSGDKKKAKKFVKQYQVEVRRQGKFKPVGQLQSYADALRTASKAAKSSIAATVELRPKGYAQVEEPQYQASFRRDIPFANQFVRKTIGAGIERFIQKPQFRIGTAGEVREIQAARRAKR